MSLTWRRYHLFGAGLTTNIEIPLLAEAGSSCPTRVSLRWDPRPLAPDPGPIVGGSLDIYLQVRRHQAGYRIELPWAALVLVTSSDGRQVTAHPIAAGPVPDPAGHVGPGGRTVASSLVTMGLGRLPCLWGWVPLHAAAVLSPRGALLLIGPPGVGKSTTAQACADLLGWPLLDGDMVALTGTAGSPAVVGLGGAQRLRGDAAARLGLAEAPRLPGFASGKIRLDPPSPRGLVPLAGSVLLQRDPGLKDGPDEGRLRTAPATFALGALRMNVQGLDDRDRAWQHLVLRTLATVVDRPRWVLGHAGRPEPIPAAVAQLAGAVV